MSEMKSTQNQKPVGSTEQVVEKQSWEPPRLRRTPVEDVTATGGGGGADSALGS